MGKLNTFFLVILIVIITCSYITAFFWYDLNNVSGYGFSKDNLKIATLIIRASVLGVCTILGILTKVLYDSIEKASERNFSIKKIFLKTLKSKQAWLAILICPIVIISFYKSIQSINSYALISLLSFQNGFFFKSILSKTDNNKKTEENE